MLVPQYCYIFWMRSHVFRIEVAPPQVYTGSTKIKDFWHKDKKQELNLKLVSFFLFVLRIQNTQELSQWEYGDGVLNSQDRRFWNISWWERFVMNQSILLISSEEERYRRLDNSFAFSHFRDEKLNFSNIFRSNFDPRPLM